MIDNQQKYLNYKEQFKRLNRDITNDFNLEAMFIAYSIMEDRSESVLKHAGKYIYNPTNTTFSLIYSDGDFIKSAITLELKPGEEIVLP